jgi:hypothetical protein
LIRFASALVREVMGISVKWGWAIVRVMTVWLRSCGVRVWGWVSYGRKISCRRMGVSCCFTLLRGDGVIAGLV